MTDDKKHVLLIAMPFAQTDIPSIQLPLLEGYLKERNIIVQTKHLYLKAAEFYGLKNYLFLINPPNNPYTAQMVFSKEVYPEHWMHNIDRFKEQYIKQTMKNGDAQQIFSFEKYVERTDKFYQWTIDNVDWPSYDIIGFTLNYGQLLPSLAVAKKIKKLWPEKKIIFGGSRTVGELGIGVMKAHPYVDFNVSGDGEDVLYRLAADYQDYQLIPGLIYRRENEVIWNKSDNIVDINSLPVPNYDTFYDDLAEVSDEIAMYFIHNGKLPVEISRGCWWNKCTFCNLNIQHQKYREKQVDRIIKEIIDLSEKYEMLHFHLIGNTLPKENYRLLLEKLKPLNLLFFAEARADQLTSEDYTLLKEAGFIGIQTGIESFSHHYLKKMNKGTRVIDNIAALKFCIENNIFNSYNLIVDYPNEEPIDFEETKQTIQLFKQYFYPPQLAQLYVLYGSPIQCHPEQFNIETLENTTVDNTMHPPEALEKKINFVFDFKKKIDFSKNDWMKLIEEWKQEYIQRKKEGIKSQHLGDKFIFFYADARSFLRINDYRDRNNFRFYVLEDLKRDVFLSCINIVSLKELQEKFLDVPEHELLAILHKFEEQGIIYQENNHYLSLPLSLQKITNRASPEEIRKLPLS